VALLVEGIGFDTLLTLKVEEYPIYLVGTRRPTEYIMEKTVDLFFENTNNKASRCLPPIKRLRNE
jgi:hypothetical protein